MQADIGHRPVRQGASSLGRKPPTPEALSDPVGDLPVPELQINVAQGRVAEGVASATGGDRPTGVRLSSPSLLPGIDPAPRLLRIETAKVPSLDVWIAKRIDDGFDIGLGPRTKRDPSGPGQDRLFESGEAATGNNGRDETWHRRIIARLATGEPVRE